MASLYLTDADTDRAPCKMYGTTRAAVIDTNIVLARDRAHRQLEGSPCRWDRLAAFNRHGFCESALHEADDFDGMLLDLGACESAVGR